MATIEYERYLSEVRGEIETCPEVIALNAIRNTVIDFCQKTTVWRMDLSAISVSINVADYDISIDSDTVVAGINWGYLTDSVGEELRLGVTSEDTLDNGSVKSVKLWRTKTGTPHHIYLNNPTSLRLVNIPEEAYTLYAGIWAKPSRESYDAPDYIYEKYLEAIAAGAKARILSMTTRPWFNASAAVAEKNEYRARCSSALIDSTKSHTRLSKTVEMRPFA